MVNHRGSTVSDAFGLDLHILRTKFTQRYVELANNKDTVSQILEEMLKDFNKEELMVMFYYQMRLTKYLLDKQSKPESDRVELSYI